MRQSLTHGDPLDRIKALTPDQRTDALNWLSGYAPEAVEAALNAMDRQEEMYARFLKARAANESRSIPDILFGRPASDTKESDR